MSISPASVHITMESTVGSTDPSGGVSVGSGSLASLLPIEAKNILRMLASFPNPDPKAMTGASASGDAWGFSEGNRVVDNIAGMEAFPPSVDDDAESELFEVEADLDDESSYALSVEFQEDGGAVGGSSTGAIGMPSSSFPGAVQNNASVVSIAGLTSSFDASLDFADTVAARALLNRIRGANSGDRPGARGGSGVRQGVVSADQKSIQAEAVAAQGNQLPMIMMQPDYRVEIVRLRSELNAQKDAFKDLEISPAMFETLRLRPEFELSLLEYVRMRAASIYLPLKAEVAGLREQTQKLSATLQETSAHMATLTNDMDVCRRLCDSNVEAYKLDAAAAVSRAQRLSERVAELEGLCGENQAKANRCDKAEAEAEQMRAELRMLRERWTEQGAVLVQLGDAERSLRNELQSITSSHSLISQDKDFLSREVLELRRQMDEVTRQADADRERALSAELKNRELSEQLLAVRLKAQTDIDERVRSEVAKLREEAASQLAEVRATSQSVIDREHNVLSQRAVQLESEVAYLRQQLTAATRAAEDASRQLHLQQTTYTADTSALRSELKLSAYSERGVQLQRLTADLEHSREEVNALRAAMFELESQQAHGRGALLAELEALRHRVSVYESLEAGIDSAVQVVARAQADAALTGSHARGGGVSHSGVGGGALEQLRADVFAELKGMSIDPHRRLQQAIDAVTRCIAMERERSELQSRIGALESENKSIAEELKLSKTAFENSMQPSSYLALRLKDRDEAVLRMEKELVQRSARTDALADQLSRSKAECDDLRERLSLLLRQRAEVESLRALLLQMQTHAETVHLGDNSATSSGDDDGSSDSDSDSASSDYERRRRRRRRSRSSSRRSDQSRHRRGLGSDARAVRSPGSSGRVEIDGAPRYASPTASSTARLNQTPLVQATAATAMVSGSEAPSPVSSRAGNRSNLPSPVSPRFVGQRGAMVPEALDNSKFSTGSGNISASGASKLGSPSGANTSARSNVHKAHILLSPNKASPKWHKREILPSTAPPSSTATNIQLTNGDKSRHAAMGPPISAIRGLTTNTASTLTTNSSANASLSDARDGRGIGSPTSANVSAGSGRTHYEVTGPSPSLRISAEGANSVNSGNDDEAYDEEYSDDDGFDSTDAATATLR